MAERDEFLSEYLSKFKKVMEARQGVEVKHFHPEQLPNTLDEALEIYKEHGKLDFIPEALEIKFYTIVSNLIKGDRFIVMSFPIYEEHETYIVMEFDEDFENIEEVYEADNMDDVLAVAYGE